MDSLLTYIYQEKAEERFRKQEKEKWEKEKEIEKKRIQDLVLAEERKPASAAGLTTSEMC